MIEIIKGAGLLIYPLGICSFAMVFIICERTYALRTNVVMPQDLVDAIIQNKPYSGGKHSVLARILDFAEEHEHDEDAVKAFARLEINRMERGIPYLDVIYAAGPLLGPDRHGHGPAAGVFPDFPGHRPAGPGGVHQGRGARAFGDGHRP